MSDYDTPIDTSEYLYRKPVYYTNPYSTYQTNLIVKLILTESNFNFDLANEDGSDFRLMEYRTGTGVLKMWIAYWNKTTKHAVLFFKVPDIGGGASVTFTAWWGNPSASSISSPEPMGFLFYETFSSTPLDSTKWSGDLDEPITEYGYRFRTQQSFTTVTGVLGGVNSWIIEAGIYPDFDETGSFDLNDRTFGFGLTGTENDFDINIMHLDRIEHNAIEDDASYEFSIKTYGGLEGYCYQDVSAAYNESEDNVIVKFSNRATFSDVTHTLGRKVEGDTRPTHITLYGRQTSAYDSGGYPCYISWLMVRAYDSVAISELDGSSLYVEYETVNHQVQDHNEYSSDITSITYAHETSFGGNPYLLSDEGYDSDTTVWQSDVGATSESSVALTIHTGWEDDITNKSYTHFDSGHVYYYNASKLSDEDEDRMARTYWQCTTTSGWAAIRFPTTRTIGALRIKNTTVSGAMPKSYEFYGSNYNPYLFFDRATKLEEGTFYQTEDWQALVLTNSYKFRYYILDIKDTYGGENIEIQEWQMMDSIGQTERRYVSQLRLHPALYGDLNKNFPTEISLQGSIDNYNWTTIMPWTRTYTPFVQHVAANGYWQRYSFYNINGYWSFRLLCRGNWGATDSKIVIGEWSMHELSAESYTYRLLAGSTNNMEQIWALDGCGIDDVHSIIFMTNEKLNKISSNKLVDSEELPPGYLDFNVV